MNLIPLSTALLLFAGPSLAADAYADLKGPDGTDMGRVELTATPDGVLVSADVMGLPAGGHGFHIHETGTCTPDFAAAGDHYNPADTEHGFMNENGHHAGDLPNIFAAADGTAKADILTDSVSLEDGAEATLFDDNGSAIIVHENADTYAMDAGAGGRLACGVVMK